MNIEEKEKKVRFILDKVRPYIQNDGGDVEFVRIENGIVFVKMLGACVGCASVDVTLTEAIETIILEEVPGIIGVEQVFDDF
ncbi:MAG: NifU family protein [Bacilli bacterium]|jgi:Fe-S cluster biogenesis protein NfuA|nr:NifU family protein [Bacilli bacterium]MDD2681845.1 NifU family protein [Bacilli bacterium]MDD3121326.1 NifU family protein [Bacilli bacterium]MDD4063423.1 NifU family protein [Bacilli bacterium]MDD4482084.1 NifU family protein [Bacilli bacterium]